MQTLQKGTRVILARANRKEFRGKYGTVEHYFIDDRTYLVEVDGNMGSLLVYAEDIDQV